MSRIPAIGIVPIDQMQGEDSADTDLLRELRKKAENYVNSLDWFPGITEMYYGAGVGGIFAIFLIRTYPNAFSHRGTPIDEWLWVVVGDIPSAYLVLDVAQKPSEACEVYLELMTGWIDCVESGEVPSDNEFPVNMEPTPENAALLHTRTMLIQQHVLPVIQTAEAKHTIH